MAIVLMESCIGAYNWVIGGVYYFWPLPPPLPYYYYKTWHGMSFVASANYKIYTTKTWVWVSYVVPSDLSMHLYNLDEEGLPIGEPLATITNPLTWIDPPVWQEFIADWSEQNVLFTKDVKYAWICEMIEPVPLEQFNTAQLQAHATYPHCGCSGGRYLVRQLSNKPGHEDTGWLTDPYEPPMGWINYQNYGEEYIPGLCMISTYLSAQLRGYYMSEESSVANAANLTALLTPSSFNLRTNIICFELGESKLIGDRPMLLANIGGQGITSAGASVTSAYLVGDFHGQSWLWGGLDVTHYTPPPLPPPTNLRGWIGAQSTIQAQGMLLSPCALHGAVIASSNTTGWLSLEGYPVMYGGFDGQSDFSAELVVDRGLRGSFGGQSDFNAWLGLPGELRGSFDGLSYLVGYLDVSTDLQGSFHGQSEFTGRLSEGTERPMDGVVTVTSNTSGGLTMLWSLRGTIEVVAMGEGSGGGGDLSYYEPGFMISEAEIIPIFLHETEINERLIVTY